MTRAVLWLVPLLGLVAGLLGRGAGEAGPVLGLALGAGVAVVLHGVGVGRVRRLARRTSWLVAQGTPPPPELAGGTQWRELGTAVDALGAELRDTRAQLDALAAWGQRLVEALDLPALLFDEEQHLLAHNQAATALFGLTAGAPSGGSPLRVLGSAVLAGAVERAASTGEPLRLTTRVGERDVEATTAQLDQRVLLLVTDRSEQRRVEELRRDFITNASHELKTPVTAIATLVSALQLVDGERRARLLGQLEDESDRLVSLVHDLLDLRRVDDGGSEDERGPVDLVALVGEGTRRVRANADAREVAVRQRLPAQALVVGRRHDLQLVVDNLLGNAVTYNREGGEVEVVVTAAGGEVVLRVRDTGIGIPRQEVPRIFERFYRVDPARSRAAGGTGLGLSIVRHVVEGHGGTVEVESLLGAGTTFTVRLPVTAEAGPRRVGVPTVAVGAEQPGGVASPSTPEAAPTDA